MNTEKNVTDKGNFSAGQKNRILLAVVAGLLAVTLGTATPRGRTVPVMGWWGVLYPQYCFEETHQENKGDIRLTFWLAKALDW